MNAKYAAVTKTNTVPVLIHLTLWRGSRCVNSQTDTSIGLNCIIWRIKSISKTEKWGKWQYGGEKPGESHCEDVIGSGHLTAE